MRRTREVEVSKSVFFDLHDGRMNRHKLEHETDEPFEILKVSKETNTVVFRKNNET